MKTPINLDLYRSTGKKVKDVTSKLNNKSSTQKTTVDEQIFDKTLQKRVISDKNKTL